MMKKSNSEKLNLVAAAVIFLLLGLHMTIMHTNVLKFLAPHGDDNDATPNVLFRDGKLFFTVTYVLLLGAALYHGFYGLRAMLAERIVDPGRRQVLTTLLVLAGVGLFAFGTWAAIAAHFIALGTHG